MMYTSFFGITEKPFAITPDPRYLYLSERHAEALAHLLYGIDDAGGFVQLTGEVGTGKTTMVRSFLTELPEHADVALILNPRVTPEEFLLEIADELHVAVPATGRGSVKAIVDGLNAFLLERHALGRRVVVIVDEAQQLSADVLEQVRLLTNLETATRKLLQIILVGQPELRDVLARNDLRQLAQRITGRYHLDPLSAEESAAYVRHRMRVAGAIGEVFTDGALRELHRLAGGVPRLINVIADRALLGAYTAEQRRVSPALIRHAAAEVHGRSTAARWLPWAIGGALAVVMAVIMLSGYAAWSRRSAETVTARGAHAPPPATATSAASPVPSSRPAAAPSVSHFLAAHDSDAGTDGAFATLFALWNTPFDAQGARPCEQATAQGLECVADRGTYAQLQRLNRPAILSLALPDGSEHQVVVSSLSDTRARLAIGTDTFDADLLELQRYWFGEYLVLWRPPFPTTRQLKPDARGPEVRWLRGGLAAALGVKPLGTSSLYDHDLAQRVKEFQRTHHLTVDGIAGEDTLMVLDALVGAPDTPTLRPRGD